MILNNLKNKNIVVVGAGKTGVSTANFLAKMGCDVTLNDIKPMEKPKYLNSLIKFVSGTHPDEIFKNADLIVLSPGIDKRDFLKYEKKITGDIEIFYHFNKSKIIAITGTNGKSTTTTIIGEVLKKKFNTFVGGNIGIPVLESLMEQNDYDFSVLELSSFQLELIDKFKPDIAVVLNITPDHLNRYSNFNEYKNAKLNIFKNDNGNMVAVLNNDDENLKDINLKSMEYMFSLHEEIEKGAFLKENKIVFKLNNRINEIFTNSIYLKGMHFYEDIMAAGIVCLLCGVEFEIFKDFIKNFKGLPHRMEFIEEINGVKFYNDSKSTTVDSTVKALKSFDNSNVILLLGGVHKGESYSKIGKFGNIKKIICYGEAKNIIYNDLKHLNIEIKENFSNAVESAIAIAERGDVVLLSPACSSFDEFNSFVERGEKFRCMVMQLKTQKQAS